MRSGSWNSSGAVAEVSGRLEINGVEVPASDLSVTRSIPSNLPDQVAGVGGYQAASGSATVMPQGAVVTERSPTPWGAETPQPLTPLVARAVSDGQRATVFTGMVDRVSGAASGTSTDVTMVDATDRLNTSISMRGLCAVMPPPTTDGSTNKRNIDLNSTYLVDRVLRECGFFATPPNTAYCVMSAPLQGSTWPEVGTVWTSNREGTIQNLPWWREAPWGVASKGLTADYRPNLDQWGAIDGTLSSRAMEISLCAGPTQNTSGRVSCQWPDGVEIAVTITSSRSVLAMVKFSGGDWQTLVTATAGELGSDWRIAAARFTPRGDGTMSVEIGADTGARTKKRTASVPYSAQAKAMENVELRWSDNSIGGVQVGFPGRAFEVLNHKMTAVLSPPVPFVSLYVCEVIRSVPAIDLLQQWSKAECAAMWIDEDGIFRWSNREQFVSGPIVWTGTSTNDLLDLNWSHDVQGAARRVVVDYEPPAVRRSKRSRMIVWQGGGQTMEYGDVVEEFIESPEDEVWIGVDASPLVFQAETSKRAFNKGSGSWVGYVGYDTDGDVHGNTEWVGYTHTVEYLDVDTWKLTQQWNGNAPTGLEHIKLQTLDSGTVLKPQWQGFNLPVWRAQLAAKFTKTSIATPRSGPVGAPDLTHDAGRWVQSASAARSLAYWLAQQTAKPRPVVEDVEIMPDPRLQVGDKIRVHDTHRTGLRITGVITEIKQAIAAGDHSMSLRLLVSEVLADKPTLAEYDAAFSGATLSVRDETWGTSTLAAFDADPLKR